MGATRWAHSIALVVFAAALPSTHARADLSSDLAGCAAIAKSADRLACYDALTENVAPGTRRSSSSVEGSGKWKVTTEVSPVDDSTNVYLHVDSEDTIAGKFGGETRPTLTVRCKENETDLYVSWDTFLGSETTEVLIRLDKEKARQTDWSVSTDHDSTFHTNAISLIKEMLQHDLLLARTTPYSESPVTATFDIRGLTSVIGRVQEACHWK